LRESHSPSYSSTMPHVALFYLMRPEVQAWLRLRLRREVPTNASHGFGADPIVKLVMGYERRQSDLKNMAG
jgi:hypothetical protein